MNEKGNVVFFTMPDQPNLEERLKGYKDAFAGFPGIKIVDVFDIKGDSGTAMDKTAQYLGQTGANKIDAFICLEASAGKDVGLAFQRAHAAGRLLVAMDGRPRHPQNGEGRHDRFNAFAKAVHHGAARVAGA